ncbi:MAG: acyl-CoA dehydrogenase family protein [Bacteroidales bacterium]
MEDKKVLKSGEFLVKKTDPKDVFIPEEFNEEQIMIAQTCQDFLDTEVYPHLDELDSPNYELMHQILKKSGELGLMGIALPEEYGGYGQDFVTQMLTAETIGAGYSFSVAFMAHCGIGTLPIAYYGDDFQREKYVTKLATGEYIGAYCLTEPGAGSDANSGKTNAVLSEDGTHYILNGQKMWITNAGFADIETVFAKIGNDRILSAFIVEKDWDGVVVAPDEKKMGIKGSSTAQIFYNDVKVPVENLIGKQGEGFRIALNILHMGRIKLGANVLGAAKTSINDSVQYANERKQFGVLISTFGAIQYKLAQQVIKTFAHESATYRLSKDIDIMTNINKENGMEPGRAAIEAIAHYAVEAALLKVYGSECLDYVVDEGVQIHGGMGYSAEMNIERAYRDSRINRIFEGTNEINRFLIADTAIKKAQKGEFELFEKAQQVFDNIDSIKGGSDKTDYFGQIGDYVENFKDLTLLAIHTASQFYKRQLTKEQEVVHGISDMMTEIYVLESLALRLEKLSTMRDNIDIYKDILDVYLFDASFAIYKLAVDIFNTLATDAELKSLISVAEKLTAVKPVNTKEARRRIAAKLIEDNKYNF